MALASHFVQDVGQQRLCSRVVGNLAAEQSGHHFDAGEEDS